MTEPCVCWRAPRVWLHDGHCCFDDGWDDVDTVVCGHLSEGLVLATALRRSLEED